MTTTNASKNLDISNNNGQYLIKSGISACRMYDVTRCGRDDNITTVLIKQFHEYIQALVVLTWSTRKHKYLVANNYNIL
jgi:hypothetical protein